MTTEAGECNGKINGSKVEIETMIDLKENGIGEEIGGSFVIVNGDSGDHSDRDLDAECKKLDLKSKLENDEIWPKEDALVNDDEKLSEENGSGSDIRVEVCKEIVSGEKLESDAELVREEVESDNVNEEEIGKVEIFESVTEEKSEGDDTKEQEIGKEEALESGSGSDVKIEHEKEERGVNVENLGEVVVEVEKDLGDVVQNEDLKEAETVITGTVHLEESAGSLVEEEKPVSANKRDEGVINVEEDLKTVDIVGKSENLVEIDSILEAEPKPETHPVVEETEISVQVEAEQESEPVVDETENLVELETAVVEVELEQEPTTEVEDTETLADLGSVVEVEPKQETDNVMEEEMHKSEVENKEPEVVAEENNNETETESAVEVEAEQEPEIVTDDAADKIEIEEKIKEPGEVVAVGPSYKHILLGVLPIQYVDINVPANESLGQVDTEISDNSLKDALNGEARNFPGEKSGILNVAQQKLAEEVSASNDDRDVQLGVVNGYTTSSECKKQFSSEDIEPHSSGPLPSTDREIEAEELCPNKDTEAETKDSVTDVEINDDVAVDTLKVESDSGIESAEGSESVVSSIEGDKSINKDADEPSHEQVQAAEIIQATAETHVIKRHRVYMIKVPRFVDDELQKKIQDASKIVEEKTDIRAAIGKDIQKKMGDVRKCLLKYHAVLAEEKGIRGSMNDIRQKIESVQESINRINNANSIADIDEKIRQMVHRQQHETMSLKQEKQYINDIKQMKHLREQLSLRKAPQEQIDKALNQKDEIEAHFKDLKKQLDLQRATLSSAESKTKSAREEYMDEDQCLKNLKKKYNAADEDRQEAYLELRKLRNQSTEKAKHFKMFKADELAAKNYMFSGDNEGLLSHCSKQVERIMDLWNNNVEFRKKYVKSNFYSTVRRLDTADGRALGPGEKSPIIQSYVNKRSNIVSVPSSSIETSAPVLMSEVRQGNLTEPSTTKQVPRKNQSAKLKSSTKSESMPTISSNEESMEEEKKSKMTEEEEALARKAEELARKEEELRKEKAAKEEELRKQKALAEKKEQLRLEQKAKAKEAEERKRRKAEKAQAKAEYKAKKEAELKEQKKAKKNKKFSTTDTTNAITEGETISASETNPSETTQEPESSSVAAPKKRSSKPVSSTRQYNKVQAPVPSPLRNRSKRKMKTWMWASLAVLLVLVLFIAGNYIYFSTSSLPSFKF